MATKTFTQLTAETTTAAADEFPFWDASAAAARKVTLTNLFGTIPVAVSMTSPAAGTVPLTVNTAASPTADAMALQYNGTAQVRFLLNGARANALQAQSFDNGASTGTYIVLNHNNNGSTPAAGYVLLRNLSGSAYRIWPDTSGNLRIHTADPTNANDTAGTVIGTQTSWHGEKENIVAWDGAGAEALAAIRALRLYRYQMVADGQQTPDGEKPTYSGLVIFDEDREANAWFGLGYAENQTPTLNQRTIIGYLMAAIQGGAEIIDDLIARVEALEGV